MSDESIIEALLASGLDDWVMLHDLVWEATGGDITAESKGTAERTLDRLFTEGLMVPGDLTDAGFTDWPGPPAAWLPRALAELEKHQWAPQGAGFWLRLTEEGKTQAAAAERREAEPSPTERDQ